MCSQRLALGLVHVYTSGKKNTLEMEICSAVHGLHKKKLRLVIQITKFHSLIYFKLIPSEHFPPVLKKCYDVSMLHKCEGLHEETIKSSKTPSED